MAQTAAKLILEPIFEADLEPNAYGYRPNRSAQDAVEKVGELLHQGYTDIVDADLSKYFDTIPHAELMQCVARRIVDKHMLHLIKIWLKVPVEERDEKGNKRLTGGRDNDRGTPDHERRPMQTLSADKLTGASAFRVRCDQPPAREPLHEPDVEGMATDRTGGTVSGANSVIRGRLRDPQSRKCRGKAKEALEWTRGALERLELTLNEKKTSVRDARRERFDFLGYTFGPHYSARTGREYIGRSPSKKSVNRIKEKVGDILKPQNVTPWEEVRDRLNQTLTGWKAYFGLGSTSTAYSVIDERVEERVRHFLRRRHKVSSQGTRQFSMKRIYGELGVFRLRGPLRVAGS